MKNLKIYGKAMSDISIRKSKNAKIGLRNMISYINLIQKTKEMCMAEIGCYVGDSTEIFAQHFKLIFAIDPWENGYDPKDAASYQFPMSVVEAQFDKMAIKYQAIVKKKSHSQFQAPTFDDRSLDLVYIDGIHTYEGCKKDIELWTRKIKLGGFLCGHDYQDRFAGVKKAVNEFRKPDKIFEDTSWLIRL